MCEKRSTLRKLEVYLFIKLLSHDESIAEEITREALAKETPDCPRKAVPEVDIMCEFYKP